MHVTECHRECMYIRNTHTQVASSQSPTCSGINYKPKTNVITNPPIFLITWSQGDLQAQVKF